MQLTLMCILSLLPQLLLLTLQQMLPCMLTNHCRRMRQQWHQSLPLTPQPLLSPLLLLPSSRFSRLTHC